jgi:membrane protease subunit HflK
MNEETLPTPRHVLKIQAIAGALYRRRRIARLLAVLAVFLGVLTTGVRIVQNDERGLRRRFGKLVDGRVSPGATFVVPVVETLEVVSVGSVRTLPLQQSQNRPLEFITGDENLVEIAGQLQYRIEDAGLFRTAQSDPEGVLFDSAISSLAHEISTLPVDDVLTTGKSAIQETVRSTVQSAAERSRTGILLLQVSLSAVGPPSEASDAFSAVSDAAAGRERRVSEAQGKAAQALSLARAQAETEVRQAQSSGKETTEAARAAEKGFLAIAEVVDRSPEPARARLYRESVSKVLQRARVIVMPPQSTKHQLRIFLGRTEPEALLPLTSLLAPPPPTPDGE